MAVFILLLYLTLAFTRPYELYPSLQPVHMMQLVGGMGIIATLANLPMTEFSFRAKQLYLTLLFMLFVTMSRTLAQHWIGGAVVTFEEVGITAAVFLMTIINITTMRRVRLILGAISVLALYLTFQSILAIHFGAFEDQLLLTQRVSDLSEETITRVRGTGFMMDPNDLAQSMLMALPFIGLRWRKGALPRNFFLVLLPMAFVLYGVYLTHSRGAVVSLVIMLLATAHGAMGRVAAAITTAMGAFLALAANFAGGRAMASTTEGSTRGRLESWSTGLQLLKSHPLIGVGYKQFVDFNGSLTAHNSVVLCFAELGFPAFCVWVGLLLVTILELRMIRKLKPETLEDVEMRRFARAIQISLYGFLTAAWFLSRTYILTLYLLIALGAALGDIARRAGKPVQTPALPKLVNLSLATAAGLVIFVYATIKLSVR